MRFVYNHGDDLWLDTHHKITKSQLAILQLARRRRSSEGYTALPTSDEPDIISLMNAGYIAELITGEDKLIVSISHWGKMLVSEYITDEDPR